MTHSKLPYADEIRAARTAFDVAHQARLDLIQVDMAIASVDQLLLVRERIPHADLAPPGDAILAVLRTERGLTLDAPEGDDTLATRRALLEQARALLEPIASQAQACSDELERLSARQSHALHHPGHEDAIEVIKEIDSRRQAEYEVFAPAKQRLAVIDPTLISLTRQIAILEDGLAGRADDDGVLLRKVLVATHTALASISATTQAVGLEINLPTLPTAPDEGVLDEASAAVLWQALEQAHKRLVELHHIVASEQATLQQIADEAEARHEALAAEVKELMG